jgi:hypothetical protein
MSNQLFDPGREGFLAGEIDWDTAVIKAALVRGYTFTGSHKFVSEITGAGGTLVAAVTGGADVAASAQRVIAFLDTASNLPVTPNGGDITVSWDNGSNKIFKL